MFKKSKKKRILIISSQRPYYGGTATTAYSLTKLLNDKFDVKTIFVFHKATEDVDPDHINNTYGISINNNKLINLIYKKIIAKFVSKNSKFNLQFISLFVQLRYLLFKLKFKPDLIIVNHPTYFNVIHQVFSDKKLLLLVTGCFEINDLWGSTIDALTIINNELTQEDKKKIKKIEFPSNFNGSVIFNSLITQKIFASINVFNGKSDVVFFNLMNKINSPIKKFSDRKYDIAFIISRFDRKVKNPALALEAFNRFPSNKKIAVGKDSDNFGNCPNTTVIPLVHQDEILKILSDVKVLIVTSYCDSSPGIQAEAIAMGATILSSKNIGWAEHIDKECVVDNYFDIEEWVKKIEYLINNYQSNSNFKNIIANSEKDILKLITATV